MKIKMQVYLEGFKSKIKRTILVNDNISLKVFCQYIIVSMNGNCKHLYQLILNEEYGFLGPGCKIEEYDEEYMEGKTLEYLNLKIGDKLLLNYDFKCDWEFMIKVDNIEEGYFNKDFEVIAGCGCGIVEDVYGVDYFKFLIDPKKTEEQRRFLGRDIPAFKDYYINNFDLNNVNKKISEFLTQYYEYIKPKRYEMYVTLDGFNREIKRKISVDSNLSLDNFCRGVIYSMRGDLSHSYGIKKGKEYLDETFLEKDLNYLELQKNQRLNVIYDYGDDWIFNIRVSKVLEGYNEKRRFGVLSGKGYGIIDDCGGTGALYEIFEGINTDWGKYDINDFDIDKINNIIDIYL